MFVRNEDVIILKYLKAGDTKGMAFLFDRYYRPLVLFADSFLCDLAWAEDVVQEQFVKFWERELFLNVHEKALSTFLFVLIKNACINVLGRKGIPTEDISAYCYDIVEEEVEDLDERTVNTVRSALERLPQRMKEVVVYVVCEGCSYAEAAERMGVSVNTVKTSLRKGMKELREMLEEKRDFLILLLYGEKIFC